MFDYHEEVRDNNWMFWAISRTTFGSMKYHSEVRAQAVAYMTARSDRFSAGQNDFEDYLILLRDYQAWCGQQELHAFAKLYAVNINVYDRITTSNPIYHISSGISTYQTISSFIMITTMIRSYLEVRKRFSNFAKESIKSEGEGNFLKRRG